MTKNIDFSEYILGEELLENLDKCAVRRAILLEKQIKENRVLKFLL